ncbi:MAG: HDOD domain-containing protein [Nibricoccus sp.]
MTVALGQPREKLLKIAQQMPASARVLAQLGQLLMDVNSGLEEIARLLKRDTALAARVIRISNSAAYGSGGGIASIEDAVGRVGFAEVYRLTGFASAAQVFDHDLPAYGVTGAILRANTLLTALAIESLAKRSAVDSRAAYTAGLMRSVGKVVLDKLGKQSLGYGQDFIRSGQNSVLEWEQTVFATSNAQAAEVVLTSWNFPATVSIPVREQHLVNKVQDTHLRTATLLNLAGGIAAESGYVLPGEAGFWEVTPDKLRVAGMSASLLKDCAEEAREAFAQIKDSLD